MKIAILGLGTIGIKLVEYLSDKGFKVYAYNWRNIEKKEALFLSNLDNKIKYEKIGLDRLDMIKANVIFTSTIDGLNDVDLFIDCTTENYERKAKLYQELVNRYSGKVLATTTSSLDLSKLATNYEESYFLGLHVFNPPTKMRLIELSYLQNTSSETKDLIRTFLFKLDDKKIIELPVMQGYIVNRLLFPYMNSAFKLMDDFGLEPSDVDEAMKAGTNMPMGPCELSDYIGNDITLHILEVFYDAFGGVEYLPCKRIKELVLAGKLGRKSKQGFYSYQ